MTPLAGLPTPAETQRNILLVKFFLLGPTLVALEDWYIDVFRALLTQSMKSHEELESGRQEKRLGRLAWAARNFLELKVWAQYVIASKDNAKHLYDDRFLDARDLMKRVETHIPSALLNTVLPGFRENRSKVEQGFKEAGFVDNDRYLKTSGVAADLGLSSEFSTMNAFLSKLVHPTAFSLFGRATDEGIYQLLFGIGAWYCNDTLVRLDVHLKSLGLKSYLPSP
jgi:hypothetical protein